MGALSGGQRKRVALAHELIFKPDILILDEPTNHLDADTIEWLEKYLARYTGMLLLVTHDRYFLDRVTDHILEVDRGGIRALTATMPITSKRRPSRKSSARSKATNANSSSRKSSPGSAEVQRPARANQSIASKPPTR
jgi:ATPase subunit of ABC transporter with duplicated ATPase domains